MRQQGLPGLEPGGRLRPQDDAGGGLYWIRVCGPPAAQYHLQSKAGDWTGYAVHHCGGNRPLYPYYITKAGQPGMRLAPNGRGFVHLADAKARAVEIYHEEARQ